MTRLESQKPLSTRALLSAGFLLAFFGMAEGFLPNPLHNGNNGKGHQATQIQMAGVAAPHQMMRVDENGGYLVPKGKVLVVTGILTTENWSGASSVVVKFDGVDVFKRGVFAGEVIDIPVGLAASSGTMVEIDRLSGATDSRVTLLGYLGDA